MRHFDYSSNNFGWGIDTAACMYAHASGLLVASDNTLNVYHPRGRGYNSEIAAKEMEEFFSQLSSEESATRERLNKIVRQNLIDARSSASNVANAKDDNMEWLSSASFRQPLINPPSAWKQHAPFAFWLVEQQRPSLIVELGTHFGFSYFCFCQQVAAMETETRCVAIDTWQGDEHAGFYNNSVFEWLQSYNSAHYKNFSQLLRSTFDDSLDKFSDGSIDLLHIDGRHFYDDVKHDYETWMRKLSKRSIVIFHDTQVRERDFGVWKLWGEISPHFPSFEFFHGHGLGVLCFGDAPEVRKLPIFCETLADSKKQKIRHTYEALGKLVENSQTLRRNDFCPCGSGVRFKHCHGKIV